MLGQIKRLLTKTGVFLLYSSNINNVSMLELIKTSIYQIANLFIYDLFQSVIFIFITLG